MSKKLIAEARDAAAKIVTSGLHDCGDIEVDSILEKLADALEQADKDKKEIRMNTLKTMRDSFDHRRQTTQTAARELRWQSEEASDVRHLHSLSDAEKIKQQSDFQYQQSNAYMGCVRMIEDEMKEEPADAEGGGMKFNINDYVTVTLLQRGADALNRENREFRSMWGSCNLYEPPEGASRWVPGDKWKAQAWEVFSVMPDLKLGLDQPFETTIELHPAKKMGEVE